ncbi:trypsin-like serine protease [Haematospirillum sp. H1815]|uniref:S1C family serine protease n=1 Tax=Haematospirillum sp. H1815 TaxID=2723108 RepID=UPI00143C5F7E|nr:trypsin-like peptidase domain-containing protein [Haematospirillum sp. H1815]NKD77016.1 trypsin-like serine protease [Haematospirillum sp. H1815]
MRYRLLAMVAVAGLAGCVDGIKVDKVPYANAPPFPEDAVLAPIRFHKGTIRVRRGSLIGGYRMGLECVDGGRQIHWTGDATSRKIKSLEFNDMFHEQFSMAGYAVTGDPANLFGDRVGNMPRAVYLVSAQIEDIRFNLCDTLNLWTGSRLDAQSGSGTVRVYWQVLSVVERKIVYEDRTSGFFSLRAPVVDAAAVLVGEAFAQAAGNFAASEGMRRLVMAPRPTRSSALATKTGDEIGLPSVSLFDTPLDQHVENVRRSVVTIDNGTDHGSGFFIAPDLILTNYHVVEGMDVVRITLNTGRTFSGDIVRYDEARDVALIQVEKAGHLPLPIRQSQARIAEPVYAIGTPRSRSMAGTVSRGIISRFGNNTHGLQRIQADADIHGGHSGGPLLDASGNVIGISEKPGKASSGLNFFIPIRDALQCLNLKIRHPNDTRQDGWDDEDLQVPDF